VVISSASAIATFFAGDSVFTIQNHTVAYVNHQPYSSGICIESSTTKSFSVSIKSSTRYWFGVSQTRSRNSFQAVAKMKLPKFPYAHPHCQNVLFVISASRAFQISKIWSKACCLIARSVLAVIPIPSSIVL
jgi:hypothetical protein